MRTQKRWRLGTRAKLLWRGWRYASLLPFASVDGWLSVDEAIALYQLARALPHEQAVAVEIGSWQGKSSICLANGLAGKNHARLCCIDPFDASGDDASAHTYEHRAQSVGGRLREAFEANLRAAGVRDLVEVMQGRSDQHAAGWHTPIDLLFLDGDHSYEACRRDFVDWAPKVRPGGYLAMHDALHAVHTGPCRVVDELVRTDPSWVEARLVGSMFVARKAMV